MGHPEVLPSPSLRYLGLLLLLTPLIGGIYLLARREPAPRIVMQMVDVPYAVYVEAPAPNPAIGRFPAGPAIVVAPSSARQEEPGDPTVGLSMPSESLTDEAAHAASASTVTDAVDARALGVSGTPRVVATLATPGVGTAGGAIVFTVVPAVAPSSRLADAGSTNSPPDASASPANQEVAQAPDGAMIMAAGTNLAAPVVWTIVVEGTTLAAPVVLTEAQPSAVAGLPQATSVPTAAKRQHNSDTNSNDNRSNDNSNRKSVNDSKDVASAANTPSAGASASGRPTVTPTPSATKTPKATPTAKESLNRVPLSPTTTP